MNRARPSPSPTTNNNNALFSVQPLVSPNGTLTFTPAPKHDGSATITVTAKDNGGTASGGNDTSAPQTSTISVTPVNDEPSFVKGADQTVNEDAGPQTVSPWATAISAGPNESGQNVTFVTSNNNNALFSAQPAVSPSGTLTYTPAANANGTATVSVYLTDDGGIANGGDDTSPTQTFTITVNAVNDAPSFTGSGNVTVSEDSAAYSATWATSISAGPADESSQTVTFNVSNDNNALFSAQPAISSSGILTFTPAANAFGSATVTVTAQDNGGVLNGGVDTSAAQTFTITVNAVNDEPTFTPGGNQSVNEDAGPQSVVWATAISAGPANESSQTVTFNVSNDNNSLFSSQPSIAPDGTLTYTPAANANGTATVTVYATDDGGIANGGDDTSATYTFTITVSPVNDPPSFTGGGNVTVDEDSGPYSASWATAISAGPANESGQTLTFNIVSNSNPSLFASGPTISASGVLAFTPAANAFGSATLVLNLQDNGGGSDTSANYTFTITVSPVNDAPSFTSGGDVTVNEDSGLYAAAWATAISPGPNESGQLVNFVVTNNNNGLFAVQPSISPTGVLTFTPALNANGSALVTVTLHDNGGTASGGVDTSAPVTFTIFVNAVNDAPTAANDTWETLGNTEIRVDLAGGLTPKIVDTTTSGNGVRDNDSDPEGDPFVVTGIVGCSDVTAPFDCTLGDGAKVSMLANGSFSYTPGPGNPIGSFQYTVTDIPTLGSPATSTGTVTFTIYDRIWYVNGLAPAGGNGTSSAPFNSFASLNGGSDVDVPGDTIFIHNSIVAGSLAAEASQKIWGEGVGLATTQNLNGNGSPQVLVAPGVRPQVSSSSDVITVTGVTGVDIAGLSLSSTTGSGVEVRSILGFPAAGATIRENVVTLAAGAGIDVNADSALGTTALVTNTSITSVGNGFDVNGSGPSVVSYNGGTITSTGANGIWLDGSGSGGNLTVTGLSNVTIDGNTAAQGIHADAVKFDAIAGGSFDTVSGGTIVVGASGNPVGSAGVAFTSVSGDYAIGSLTVFGGTSGVSVGGTGLFTGAAGMRITSGGGSISAPAGVGLSVTNTSIGAANLNFTSINSTGTVNGILLNNTGTAGGLVVSGTGSAGSGGTIQSATGDGVSLQSTAKVSLSYMRVRQSNGNGIFGNNLTDFSLINSEVTDSDFDNVGVNEAGLRFGNLLGNSAITSSTISGSKGDNIRMEPTSGVLTNLAISGSTIGPNPVGSGGNGIALFASGTATSNVTVTSSTFSGNQGSGFLTTYTGTSSGTIDVSGSQFSDQNIGMDVGSGQNGDQTFKITSNTFLRHTSNAINIITGTDATNSSQFVGTVSNNTIGNGTADSGSTTSFGIAADLRGDVDAILSITGNNVRNTDIEGIFVQSRLDNDADAQVGRLDLTLTGNTVGKPDDNSAFPFGAVFGVRVESRNTYVQCMDISGNLAASVGAAEHFRVRQRDTSTFNLERFSGAGNNAAVVATFIAGQNLAGSTASATVATTFTGVPNGTCRKPLP